MERWHRSGYQTAANDIELADLNGKTRVFGGLDRTEVIAPLTIVMMIFLFEDEIHEIKIFRRDSFYSTFS